jgi:hypothetical protein
MQSRSGFVLTFVALILIPRIASQSALGATATANPSADAFVAASNPTNNYGGAGGLAASAPGLANGEFQSLMRFDLSAAKASFDAAFGTGNWFVQSVTLRPTTTSPNNPIFNPNAAGPFDVGWMQNDAWVEGTGRPEAPTMDGVTFATLPSFLSGADQPMGSFNFPGGNSGNNTYILGLASGFTGDITSGSLASLRVFASSGATSYLFNSRNVMNVANRPLLTVEALAIPEPGTIPSSCAVAVITMRRMRSRERTCNRKDFAESVAR